MNLNDLPMAIEEPVESLLAFHRRIERQLAALCRLPVHLEVHGVDATASATAASIAGFFSHAVPLHHADEERDLMPLLEPRLGASERAEFRELRQRLDGDHRDMDATWRRLRRPLEAIGEGVPRKLSEDLVHYFRAIHSLHISVEEAGMHMLALRRMRPEDHAALERRMQARRAVTRSSRN